MHHPPASGTDPPSDRLPPDELEEVRNLLLGPEKRKITGLEQRLENPLLHAQDVSRVLPHAVALCAAKSDQLARTLTPAVESALRESVKRHPAILVDAIFPVIGPAIRRAIADTFGRLLQAVNQTMAHSLSVRGLQWRWEAYRCGKSYAEVVLCHTLVYRVEQVLLIHRQTGLLLHHVCAPDTLAQDGDMVSGMLTAIQRFMEDCFRARPGETVHTLQVGELSVWLETGPQAVLAAVIRGHAPLELRLAEQNCLEQIHQELGPALASFQGDPAPFVTAGSLMEICLQTRLAAPPGRTGRAPLILAGLVLLALGIWGFVIARENRRWSAWVRRIKEEPGIVVTESGKRAGKFYIAGFRDPLALDPAKVLPEYRIDAQRVASRWEAYQAQYAPFTLSRVTSWLRPPPGVVLRLQDGVLHAEGTASKAWTESARHTVAAIPGVAQFDSSRLFDESLRALEAGLKEIEKAVFFFDETTRLTPGQEANLAKLASQINGLHSLAAQSGRRLQITVFGHTDKKGSLEYNQRLSQQRAEQTVGLLAARAVPATLLIPRGLGATQPLRPDLAAADESLNRRVSFRVALEETAVTP